MYFNSHGSNNSLFMNNVDTILPVSTSIEKNAKYINTEGRLQSTKKCFEPSKNVLTEYDIFETVFSNSIKLNRTYVVAKNNRHLKKTLGYNNNLVFDSYLPKCSGFDLKFEVLFMPKVNNYTSFIKDFYRTDVISYNSPTMAQCSKVFNTISNFK